LQVIIPLAGKGTRLRPHTHTKAKPLVHVAGKAVIGYILDELKKINVEEIIFIIGYLGEQIKDYVSKNYDFKTKFIVQKELKGQAHAINLAKPYIKEDVLIWFADTISNPNIKKLVREQADGLIYVKEHEDPERFGIVFPDKEGFIEKIIEKPKNPKSNLANIGLYYIKDYKLMFESINYLIEKDLQTKGEFYLVDAFNLMIDKGTKLKSETVRNWMDCGKPETLLKTNQYLLKKTPDKKYKNIKSSLIIKPVFIESGTTIENCIIGPNVSISKNTCIKNSIIKNSIIGEKSIVEESQIKNSIIGSFATVKGFYKKLNVGDDSELVFGNET
jgi:glucose-1-phosphate thymidylyltransferase|tara:strand:+ start:366 stop:1358 length:993 start_codon:yes stop_codon:yes gene_type:complete